ncbi:MAG TPA: metallophosphoesterase [Candidatus Angelobacter sp.]|nr:metallophosphoesterase [Candidatus Angelobacter sp.]
MREPSVRGRAALFQFAICVFTLCLLLGFPLQGQAQVTIAQISDTHLGEPQAPHAFDNLRRVVDMVNARHPDAVIVSGDIGENYDQWLIARGILKWLHAPVYYAPGNHDVHSNDVAKYREVFGPDYYKFNVKGVTFVVIDSQLLGNYDKFDAQPLLPMPPQTEQESKKMLSWLADLANGHDADDRGRGDRDDKNRGDDDDHGRKIVIGIQHIPLFRNGNVPPDPKPYWTINEPYRSRELQLLHKLGVRDMLVGHWHVGTVFHEDGITWHVAPSVGRLLPWSGSLGFAMHTISRDGDVKTEFIPLDTR